MAWHGTENEARLQPHARALPLRALGVNGNHLPLINSSTTTEMDDGSGIPYTVSRSRQMVRRQLLQSLGVSRSPGGTRATALVDRVSGTWKMAHAASSDVGQTADGLGTAISPWLLADGQGPRACGMALLAWLHPATILLSVTQHDGASTR